jgi:hypothetical protein
MQVVFINKKVFSMRQFLIATIVLAGLFLQSCSKKSSLDSGTTPPPQPGETATLKLIPDSMFRVYLKANICPNAFDKSGKYIDITNSEVSNFTGTIQIDTITCPQPFVSSLKGIEYFTKMTKLIVAASPVDSLNLTATVALDTIRLLNDQDLQYVAVSGCTSMRYIRVSYIPVASLNFSNLPALNYINLITLARLSDLNTDNDPNLQHLMTYGLTSMKTVNVTTNSNLRRLYLEDGSAVNTIDVTHNHKLKMLVATYCGLLKSVDLSKNDSLTFVTFDDSGVDSLDFSHNPQLFGVTMLRTPIRNLSFLANPQLRLLWLDGCGSLKSVDLRAQKSFDYYFVPTRDIVNMSTDDMYQVYQDGFSSPVYTTQYHEFGQASRAGVNGATQNLYGGLRVPQYLDGNGLSLTQVKINKATKDNYSLVMARRVFSSMTPALITVYDDDMTTVLCNDYSPELFKCN